MTGYEVAAHGPGSKILAMFRAKGGRKFPVVIPSAPLRMMIASVAFATGLPLKVFDDRQEAIEYLRSLAG